MARNPTVIGLTISFLLLALIFLALHKVSPGVRGQKIFRRGYWVDLLYWFFTPLVTGFIARLAVIAAAIPLVILLGLSWDAFKNHTYQGFGPVSRQPVALQMIEIFVLGDFVGYWSHRLFHGRKLWSFHAVHHSSTEVDWLSSVRLHPLNEAGTRTAEVVPLLRLGFNPGALAAYVPLVTFYAILLHANVNWDYGPLRRIIASPMFHRWHHAKTPAAINKNFAGFCAFWDWIFGTLYMPAGEVPSDFGIKEAMPESLWGQLVHPFRSRTRAQATPATTGDSARIQQPVARVS
jgi:sterol desaturase/sphingolipid hydroxylase (fatty acid hydroxylase superfamily)